MIHLIRWIIRRLRRRTESPAEALAHLPHLAFTAAVWTALRELGEDGAL